MPRCPGLCLALALSMFVPVQASSQRPDIVLIMADDLGFADIGCFGSEILTPNLDRLAADGIQMTQFYNAARCCPTRAALLTGLYPHQTGMGGMVQTSREKINLLASTPYQGWLNDRCVTIAEVLREGGYVTALSGKWHLGEFRPHWPVDRGFDHFWGMVSGAVNYFDPRRGINHRTTAEDDVPWTEPPAGFYMTDAIADHAIGYIRDTGKDGRPLFLYVAFNAPHWPLHALPDDITAYRGTYHEGWDVLREQRHARQIELGVVDPSWPLSPRDPESRPWEKAPDRDLMDHKMAIYAAQVTCLDRGIGRILEAIEARGNAENTLVMFLSDNGACAESGPWGTDWRKNGLPPGGVDSYMSYGASWSNAGNTPFRRHKKSIHEGGIATPFIARWPAVVTDGGTIDRQVGHVVDVMATCCDVAGIPYPVREGLETLEGRSMRPIFEGATRPGHAFLAWEHIGNRGVRRGKWKVVAERGGDWELYDLEGDRTELRDLSPAEPGITADLAELWDSWARRVGARIP